MLKSYEWKSLCPVCGEAKYNDEMRKRWDGLWVCTEDWEPRHPVDFYRTKNDFHPLPFIFPDNNGVNVGVINTSTLTPPYPGASLPPALTRLGVVGVGIVGIMIVGEDA